MDFASMSLNQLAQLHHFTIERAGDAVIWVDSNARILHVNETGCQRLGYTLEELISMTIPDICPDFKMERWPEHWKKNKRKRQLHFESFHKTKDGKIFPVEIHTNFIVYEGEEMDCLFARDISIRKALESNLKRFKQLLDQGGDGIYIIDTEDRHFIDCSESACKMLGYSKEEILKLRVDDIGKGTHLNSQQWEKLLNFLRRNKEPIHLSGDHQRKDGKTIPVEIITSLMEFEGKEYMLSVARDVSEQKEAQEKLHTAFEEIRQLKNKLVDENKYLQDEIKLTHNFDEIVTVSREFKAILTKVEQVAVTNSTVLILGESGTGKELIARAIHNISNRKDRPLVKVNCAVLPENLIESELFGHEKGAFTGAVALRSGRFELADKGTIFLDEIGDLPLDLQAKLLRVLQEGEFERLGSSKTRKVDVRIIAATNKDLHKAIKDGSFREDLFYRLNVFPITCIPLCERKKDIALLANFFLQKFCKKTGKIIRSIPKELIANFENYNWPGNVRELENLIERGFILSQGDTLEVGEWLTQSNGKNVSNPSNNLLDVEKNHILKILDDTSWKIRGDNGAAKILGMNPTTLESRMAKLRIKRTR